MLLGEMSTETGTGLGSLTRRQREVLDLVAQGYTNAQIAEHLGVSLDGAKWHVREILSRLAVDSREEAAEIWSRERGVAGRARRSVRGYLGISLAVRVAAAGGVVAFGAVLVAVVVLVVTGRGDTGEPLSPEPTASPTLAAQAAPTSTPAIRPRIAWRYTATEGYALVAAGDAGVFVAAGPDYDSRPGRRFVASLDPAKGTERWRRDMACAPYQPALVGDLLVFACNDGIIYAFDPRTGDERWRSDTKGAPFSVAIAGDLLITGDMDPEYYGLGDFNGQWYPRGKVYAIDSRTGVERWRTETGHEVAFVTVDGDQVFVAAYDSSGSGTVTALATTDGTERWRQPVDGISNPAAVGADTIFFSAEGGVVALDKGTGARRWGYDLAATAVFPVLTGSVVVVGTNMSTILGLDARTGARLWEAEYCDCQYFATLLGSAVLVTGGGVGVLDPLTGEVAWVTDVGQGWLAASVLGRRVYVGGDSDRGVLAIDFP